MTYDITTHERLVTPGVEIQESTATSMKCGLNNPYEEYAVESVEVAPKAASIVAIYDASGRKQPRMQHGVNIVRMSDGTVRKIMVK